MSESRYWNLLLHNVNGESEIDDADFFFSNDGKTNAKGELHATIDALLNEVRFDDNSSACKFPARKAWLGEQLGITEFAHVECNEYNNVLHRLNPKSATLVFPSAHINSPASMFGHTFLRINSAYNSKLLSYAVNYAANANPDKENAAIFAIKGLFGGYYGKYSLLPYYDKLKEYRDSEQRDIWEYDLNLNEDEVLMMVRHIWELNRTHSSYYFFTENCSYNMLWFLEIARPTLHLKEYFNYQVTPLETVHACKSEGIIERNFYRPSKRTTLLKYEELINKKNIKIPLDLINGNITQEKIIDSIDIDIQQKRYILESSIELLEYMRSKNKISKENYLTKFHDISKARADLGEGEKLNIKTPPNPIDSHRAIRASLGFGLRDKQSISFLGLRPSYHSLQDSKYGFLRGTQIEFMNLELSYSDNEVEIEDATILSIVSIAQRSEFFENLSWRTKFGWDKNSLDDTTNFIGTVGIGFSWGNELAFIYTMADPLFYLDGKFKSAIGASLGVIFDKNNYMSTNMEITKRWYDTGDAQLLAGVAQSFRLSQNTQIMFSYNYKDRLSFGLKEHSNNIKFNFNYYF